MRVFDDGGEHANLWYELRPDQYWCGDNEEDARDCQKIVPGIGATLDQIQQVFDLIEVTKGEA